MSETFNRTTGRSVVASDTGANVGEVKAFVVDTTASKIEAIHIGGKGKKAQILNWADIRSFGNDAVMIEAETSPSNPLDEHEELAVKGKISLTGSLILGTDGFEAGKVTDAEFDPETGQLLSVIADTGTIEIDRLRSLGTYALVVDPRG